MDKVIRKVGKSKRSFEKELLSRKSNLSLFYNDKLQRFERLEELIKKWENLIVIRQSVNVAIEEKRSKKVIGSSLEAQVEILLPQVDFDIVNTIDAKELFITSNVIKNPSNEKEISVKVTKAEGSKCTRCWKIVREVKDKMCSRCSKVN